MCIYILSLTPLLLYLATCLASSLSPLKSFISRLPVLGRGMKYNFSSELTAPKESMHSVTTVGWRFHPTHEELITDYLKPKMLGYDNDDLVIGEVDFCKFEPWDLPLQSKIKSNDPVWYFLCPRDWKYSRSRLSNRTTEAGYWKPTGKPIPVKTKRTKKEIGVKKTLVFYKGRPKGVRTEWIMHEYEWIREPNLEVQGDYILRKLKKKPDEKTYKGPSNHEESLSDFEGEISHCMAFEHQNTIEMTTNLSHVTSHSRHPTTFYSDSSALTTNSACDESRSQPMDFDLGNQDPNEMVVNSTYKEGDVHHQVFFDLENQNPNELSSQTTCCSSQVDFDLENHISLSDFEDGPTFDFNISSPYDKGEESSLMAYDFGNQNQNYNFDMSVSKEGDRSLLGGTPSDFDKDLYMKTDASITDKNVWNSLNSLLQNDVGDDWLLKLSPELVAKLGADMKASIEPESRRNSVHNSYVHQAPAMVAMVPLSA